MYLSVEETLDSGTKINEFGEVIRENNTEERATQDSDVVEEVTQHQPSKQFESQQNKALRMNRFNGWYSAIDRISQNVKAKFVQMKSDIVKAITGNLQEKTNEQTPNQGHK